jgi:hypothetical protein
MKSAPRVATVATKQTTWQLFGQGLAGPTPNAGCVTDLKGKEINA